MNLRRFQRQFLARALAPGVDIGALSLPRGNGKSFLAAHILTRCLTPGDPLNQPGKEFVQCAGSLEQARMVFGFVRAALADAEADYRFIDSVTRLGITHKRTNTKLRVISSNGRTAMGLVNVPLAVCDEPGSWEIIGGGLMWDALTGALGKPGSPLKIIIIGTLAPQATGAGHWWWDMVHDGSKASTYVMSLQGEAATWDWWPTIRKANPLTAISPAFRAKLLEERDAARGDTRLKARFLSYRLNLPSADESSTLLTVDDWQRMAARETPQPDGQPFVGVDLGGGRAWSAAVAVWPTGRVEALAVAPGIPDLESQERRDRVPQGTYRRLYERGLLQVADGLRVQPPAALWDAVRDRWGNPRLLICDRFRLPELQDGMGRSNTPIEARQTRWSEAAFDIRALRQGAKDGPLAVLESDRLLVAASLAVSSVKNDDQGSFRLVKSRNNTARDDVAAALLLAAGAYQREAARPPRRGYLGVV